MTNKQINALKQSVDSDHLLSCNYNINLYDFTVNKILLISESLSIAPGNPVLNKIVKAFSLELYE